MPSPMVNNVNVDSASLQFMSIWTTPTIQPAMMSISRMMMPATGVAFDELAGAVHRAVKGCFLFEVFAPAFRFVLVDETHVEIGVDAHLLAWNRGPA